MKMWELKTTGEKNRNQWAGSVVAANANSDTVAAVTATLPDDFEKDRSRFTVASP
jgi:hypothetical protein